MDETLPHWLGRHAKERGDAPAIVNAGGTISWKALNDRVVRAAHGLAKQGVRRGEVVAAQLPNTPDFIVAYLATAKIGAIFCTLHMPYRGAEIEMILGHSAAKVFVNKPLESADGDDAFPLPQASDPFLLLYTSGTNASPKGVLHTSRAMLGNGRAGAKEHGITAESRVLCAAPLSHLYGLYSLHCAWAVGACTVLLAAFKPEDLANTVQTFRPTELWTAPAHVAACRAMGLFDKYDWSSLKMAIVSGSMCPPELIKYFSEKASNCRVTQLWGMTELQAGLYSRPGDPLEVSATSSGRPSPGTEIRLSPEGEIQVRGPSVFAGYYKSSENAFTEDGWFRSGDLGERRGENFAITGRTKDLINRGGVKFNPADVEQLLDSHPKILQSAIVPMPDPILGEKACAFVVLRDKTATLDLEEVKIFLQEKQIAKNKLPERLVVVAEMPLTPTRKVIKSRLIAALSSPA